MGGGGVEATFEQYPKERRFFMAFLMKETNTNKYFKVIVFAMPSYKINFHNSGLEIYKPGDYNQHAHSCDKPLILNSVADYISFSCE